MTSASIGSTLTGGALPDRTETAGRNAHRIAGSSSRMSA